MSAAVTSERPPPAGDAEAAILGKVPYLEGLDAETLAELAAGATRRHYAPGERIVAELEPGADVYVLAVGEAEISVDCATGDRRVLGTIGPGGAFGEMSSLTGELRSATVTARTDVGLVVIPEREFARLRERRPQVAMALVRVLSSRIAQTEKAIEDIFGAEGAKATADTRSRALEKAGGKGRRGTITRIWRELVVARRRDVAFLTLAAFVVTLMAVRLAVYLSFHFDVAPRDVLRAAYMTGFAALVGSACASLLTFRPGFRRAIGVLYGVGTALILNELGVTLAFDIFFKDIHTPDPNAPFDLGALYARSTAVHAFVLGLFVLVQAAYLRRFYRRVGFLLFTRAKRLIGSR